MTVPSILSDDINKVLKNTVFHDSLESLLKKIKSTLPAESKNYLERIEKSLHAGSGPHKKYDNFKNTIETLNEAVIDKKEIEITYYTMSRKKVTHRKVAPYKLWFYDGTFYLIGHCRSKRDIRIFAVDRIKRINLTGEKFEMSADFSVDKFMKASFGVFRGDPAKISIWFSAEVADYVKEKVWHDSQQILGQDDGSIIFSVEVASTSELKRWILRWGSAAVVLEPDELRDEIQSEAAGMLAGYANRVKQFQKALTG